MNDAQPSSKRIALLHSLSVRVCLLITGMTLVVMMIIAFAFVLFERDKVAQDIYRNGETFATFSGTSIYQNYTQFYTHPEASDFVNFKKNVSDTLSHNKDIKQVQLVGLSGRVLFSSEEFKTGKYDSSEVRTLSDRQTLDAAAKDEASHWDVTQGGKRMTVLVVPLRETGGGHFLSMIYLLSYGSQGEQVSAALARLAWVSLGLLALVVVGALLFSLSLVKPIVRLTSVAERLRAGELNARALVKSDDEVGRLALTLNSMAAQIEANIVDLEASRAKIAEQNAALRKDKVQLLASINSLDIGYIMTDANDKIVLLNAVAERVLSYVVTEKGVAKEESNHQEWTTDVIDQKLSGSFQFKQSLVKARGEGTIVEAKEVQFNGRVLRIFVAPIIDIGKDGKQQTLGSVTLLADITEQKVLERSKDEFFSIASHELRTPLTAIRGNSSMIQSFYESQMKDQGLKELVGDIHDSSIRLISIVNDFLDVSRAEQGKMSYELGPLKISEIIDNVIYELTAICKEKGITVKLEKGAADVPEAFADKNRVKQVVYNLIANAAKFTPSGGTITLSTEVLQDNLLKVYVKDTGSGIDPEAQRLLFHKFQQAGGSILTRNTERGTGLGLYICKLMLEQMGGSIKLESSQKGVGSTFSFTVPTYHGQAYAKPAATKTDDTSGLTVGAAAQTPSDAPNKEASSPTPSEPSPSAAPKEKQSAEK